MLLSPSPACIFRERPQAHIREPNTFRKEVVPFDLKPELSTLSPKLGEVMRAGGLSMVFAVGDIAWLRVGDVVEATSGWTEYAVLKEKAGLNKLQYWAHADCVGLVYENLSCKVAPRAQALDFLGPLGMTGLTPAYFGLIDVGNIKAVQTLVVSNAASAPSAPCLPDWQDQGREVNRNRGHARKMTTASLCGKAVYYKSPTFAKEFEELPTISTFVSTMSVDAEQRASEKSRHSLCKKFTNAWPRIWLKSTNRHYYVEEYPRGLKDLSSWIADAFLKAPPYLIAQGLEKAPEGAATAVTEKM
ncbi:hypothetical protein FA95DRAFT_1577328 [Auriscalpium vulgare]|uniref:Uncharacterized protein n=1 Tax=Auriscalpium vulgare TaxID=40419 RepID=A0ACB8R6W5_9AGAM|nr:hypothetical protein FA95DRAFT_1577328 [Auriscalpium vulgare]